MDVTYTKVKPYVILAGCKIIVVLTLFEGPSKNFTAMKGNDRFYYVTNCNSFDFINSCYHGARLQVKHHTVIVNNKDLQVKKTKQIYITLML